MFVLYGLRDFTKVFGSKSEWCLACRSNQTDYVRIMTWFTLFFIPLFPVAFKYIKICLTCKSYTRISKKQFKSELATPNALPPSPFDENPALANAPKQITISRKKKFGASLVKMGIYIDGIPTADIGNGKTIQFPIIRGSSIFVRYGELGGVQECIQSNVLMLDFDNNYFEIEQAGRNLVLTKSTATQAEAVAEIAK